MSQWLYDETDTFVALVNKGDPLVQTSLQVMKENELRNNPTEIHQICEFMSRDLNILPLINWIVGRTKLFEEWSGTGRWARGGVESWAEFTQYTSTHTHTHSSSDLRVCLCQVCGTTGIVIGLNLCII